MRYLLVLGLSALLLAACVSQPHKRPAQNSQNADQAGGAYSQGRPASSLPDGRGGTYKTGKPYRIAGQWYYPMQSAASYDQTGVASWYGRDFHGKKTANGERYDMHALSAAHKTLPLPTLVRVTNLDNGRSVVVRVNDRGPFVKSRLIDLSYAAARQLGYTERGTARVRVQTLDQPAPTQASAKQVANPIAEPVTPKASAALVPVAWADNNTAPGGAIFVQLGAFSSRVNAAELRDRLSASFSDVLIQPRRIASQTLYRVRIGPFDDMQKIERTVQQLQQNGYDNAVVIIE
ncbi:MAG: septal ring lytic transglycosylase RlpA family protein [Mariprofundaceae bacterium]